MVLDFGILVDCKVLFGSILISDGITNLFSIHSCPLCVDIDFVVPNDGLNKFLEVGPHLDNKARGYDMSSNLKVILHRAAQLQFIKLFHFLESTLMNLSQLY